MVLTNLCGVGESNTGSLTFFERRVIFMELTIKIKNEESVDIMFNEKCSQWDDDAKLNQMLLLNIEQRLNRQLKCYGHVFLNEVYDLLGCKRTPLGAVMGWVYEKGKEISFGLTEEYFNNPTVDVQLHFNIDGVIVNKI